MEQNKTKQKKEEEEEKKRTESRTKRNATIEKYLIKTNKVSK